MSFHSLFFGIAALIYDLILSWVGVLVLGCFALHWLKLIGENGWRNSIKHLLMVIGAIILLVIVIPETNKKSQRDLKRTEAYYEAHPDEVPEPQEQDIEYP